MCSIAAFILSVPLVIYGITERSPFALIFGMLIFIAAICTAYKYKVIPIILTVLVQAGAILTLYLHLKGYAPSNHLIYTFAVSQGLIVLIAIDIFRSFAAKKEKPKE